MFSILFFTVLQVFHAPLNLGFLNPASTCIRVHQPVVPHILSNFNRNVVQYSLGSPSTPTRETKAQTAGGISGSAPGLA